MPIAIGGTIAVIAITWFIAAKLLKEDEPTPVADEKPRCAGRREWGKSVFDFPNGEKDKAKRRRETQNDVAVIPSGGCARRMKQPSRWRRWIMIPRWQSDEWKAVAEANSGSGRPGLALWTIIDYRRLHPGKFEAELKQFEDAAFDRLWWERIRDLCELRDSLGMEIDKKYKGNCAGDGEAAYKEKLEKEKQVLVFRRQSAADALTEMGWTAKEPPNLFDAGQIANLRGQRIAETYEGWKKRVTNSLMKTRGLPWAH